MHVVIPVDANFLLRAHDEWGGGGFGRRTSDAKVRI